MNEFSDFLRAELAKRRWRQSDLARASNLDSAVISNLINGKRNPGPDSIEAISRAFGYPQEIVYRAAGLLPPEDDISEYQEMINYKITQLTDEERKILFELIQFFESRHPG